jgi:Fe-Mn family superoxide dismutase
MKLYGLPELGHDYAALEPHLSARILALHHGKHHKAYIAVFVSSAIAELELAAAQLNTDAIRAWHDDTNT